MQRTDERQWFRPGVDEVLQWVAVANGLGKVDSAIERIAELPWWRFPGEFSAEFGQKGKLVH